MIKELKAELQDKQKTIEIQSKIIMHLIEQLKSKSRMLESWQRAR
jgi:hypothetical protein